MTRSSHTVLTTTGMLFYGNGTMHCVQTSAEDRARVMDALTAPEVAGYLERVAASGYRKTYHDAPHLLVYVQSNNAFVPLTLSLAEPLHGGLEPLDRLLRRSFGRRYNYPLLPAGAERDDLQRIMPVPAPEKKVDTLPPTF